MVNGSDPRNHADFDIKSWYVGDKAEKNSKHVKKLEEKIKELEERIKELEK